MEYLTEKDLEGKTLGDLRRIARQYGINPAGKNVADLSREIITESKANAGYGTPGKPEPEPKRRAAPIPAVVANAVPEDVESEEEEEEEEEKSVKVEKLLVIEPAPVALGYDTFSVETSKESENRKVPNTVELLRSIAQLILQWADTVTPDTKAVTVVPEAKPEEVPAAPTPVVEVPQPKPAPRSRQKRDSKPEPAPEPTPTPPPPPTPPVEVEEEEDDADIEMEEEMDVTAEDVQKASFAKLLFWAKAINASGAATVKIDGVKEPELRAAILELVNESDGEEEEEEEVEESAEEEKSSVAWPEWIKDGARVEIDMEEEGWLLGTVIAKHPMSVDVMLGDGCEAEVLTVSGIRPAPVRKVRERKS